MTISKEERAELRDLIHEVSKGNHNFPVWDYDDSSPFEHPEIIEHSAVDGVSHIGNLPSKWHTRFACAAVNAAPKLLASLDAADERIAGLTARNETLLVDAATKIESLKARIAELEAADQWRPIEEVPYDVELLLTDGANVISGNKYRGWWNFAKGADFAPTHFRVLPALPEGGV